MGFVYEAEKLSLEYNGATYEFKAPTAKQQRAIGNAFKSADDDTDVVEVYIAFFVELGLPREILEEMTLNGLISLMSYSVGSKKN